jgi:hypothetical protein
VRADQTRIGPSYRARLARMGGMDVDDYIDQAFDSDAYIHVTDPFYDRSHDIIEDYVSAMLPNADPLIRAGLVALAPTAAAAVRLNRETLTTMEVAEIIDLATPHLPTSDQD